MSSSMELLRQEIEDLKRLGESWDMGKYQIEKAIMKALEDKNGNVPNQVQQELKRQTKPKRGCCTTFWLISCCITVGILSGVAVGTALYNNYTPFELYVNYVVGETQYPVLRRWRLLFLPLHHYFDVQPYALIECLVDNPWYTPDEVECGACEDASDVPRLKNVSDFHNLYVEWGNPVIVTDVYPYASKRYTMDKFMKNYEEHKEQFDNDLCEVSSLDESIGTVSEYYNVIKKLGPETPNIRWKLCYGEGLRALRRFLPKPYFVSTEGALEKFLMIVSSNEEILPVPTGQYSNAWLAQVTGASEMQIRPIAECNTTCSNFNVTLHKGEVMYLNQELWDADIVGNPTDEPAISLVSFFA